MSDEDVVDLLLNLAGLALQKQEGELQLIAVETYCERFKELEGELKSCTVDSRMEELAEKHQRVLRKAEEFLKLASKDMQAFKKRAKGIMSYVDVLPRKISVTGTKKG